MWMTSTAWGLGMFSERLLKKVGEKLTLLIEGPFNLENPEFAHLKRRRTITPEGVWIAPSENHLKKLLELCGLDYKSKTRDTPLTKEVISAEPTPELDPAEHRRFRGIVGIVMYMSTDRPDIQYATNELAMCMASPTERAMEGAKHVVRYLLGTRDLQLFFPRDMKDADDVYVMTDSDWAKDNVSRKSRSAGHIYVGRCLLYSFTRRQSVIALSSGEAEMYASASGVSEGILLRKVLAFLGMFLGLRAVSDSSANHAMNHRLGVGKVRHMDTKVLWLQQLIYKGLLTMTWQAGKDNNSDLGTKVFWKGRFLELREMCGLVGPEAVAAQVTTTRGSPDVSQILALTTLLLEMTRAKGQEDGEDEQTTVIPLVGWILAGVFLSGLLIGRLWAWCQRHSNLRAIVDSLTFYESAVGTVLHLDPKCHYLSKSKGVKSKKICVDCRARFKEKMD